ncbi:MAG TPA: 3-hydroxybutyrate dehydrogenase [Candidatus Salinicoccus stercoripullorum]|uniref:3-oxoacyl-[acyl-carrier-protein] reductase FabG n=1 Tax=Candidatus Salinicoccus stercoripullorum TaxID=2838756 RepID=A0A9D1QGQ7_9STAP|nr:3-hydroxybutyrate dehydrogenase [Candidatus Salinicoccus stercoripullorum]
MVKDKVTIITGAASGLGLEISKVFLKNGAKVVLSDINQEKLDEIVEDLKAKTYDCLGIRADVTSEDDIKNLIDRAKEEYGRIDVLFNNAGLQHVSDIEEFPTDKFRQMIDIMLVAPFIGTKHVMPIMKEQGSGTILNMASINGVIGFAGKAAYNSAKHGVIGLTKVAALEAAEHGITVNAICPGYVDTPLVRGQMEDLAQSRGVAADKVIEEVLFPLIPQKRLIEIGEIADYAMFLTSDSAKGVTGQAVLIDGGYTVQ